MCWQLAYQLLSRSISTAESKLPRRRYTHTPQKSLFWDVLLIFGATSAVSECVPSSRLQWLLTVTLNTPPFCNSFLLTPSLGIIEDYEYDQNVNAMNWQMKNFPIMHRRHNKSAYTSISHLNPYKNLGRNNYDRAGVSELRAYINIGFALKRREERETSHIRWS